MVVAATAVGWALLSGGALRRRAVHAQRRRPNRPRQLTAPTPACTAGLRDSGGNKDAADPASLPEVLRPFPGPRLTELPQFGGAHAERLLWGTYRPGFYFGEASPLFPLLTLLSLRCR